MTDFTTIIQKFRQYAEKTGWTYVEIPADVAEKIKPGFKKSYRVKGFLDHVRIDGVSILPSGDGGFFLPLNTLLRKKLNKQKGAPLHLQLEEDADFDYEIPAQLAELLADDPGAKAYLFSLAPSHRRYFFKYYQDAKTEMTKLKRIEQIYDALQKKWDYGLMIRRGKPRQE